MTEEWKLPPYIVNEIGELSALAETKPEQLTRRGDFEKIKRITGNGKGVVVGVCDTGLDEKHRSGELINTIDAKDFTGSRFGWRDRNGHHSHCACHIGAKKNESGIEGIASDCEFLHAKVLGDSGSGSSLGIARGIDWCVENGANIINLSLGGGYSQIIENACKRAYDKNVWVFAALGNSGNQGDGHPGNSRYTIGIAAIDFNLRLANFSSRSNRAILSGYGVNVLSCITGGRYARMSGTSMATPDQVGIAALLRPYLESKGVAMNNQDDYVKVITPFIRDLGSDGWDRGYGLGFLDINVLLDHFEKEEDVRPDEPDYPHDWLPWHPDGSDQND